MFEFGSIEAKAAAGDGVPHCAGSSQDSLDIGGKHESLGHEVARSALDMIEVVLFVRVAFGDRETGIAGLLPLVSCFGEWHEGADEARQIFETS